MRIGTGIVRKPDERCRVEHGMVSDTVFQIAQMTALFGLGIGNDGNSFVRPAQAAHPLETDL